MSIQTLQLVALNPKPPRAFPDYFFLPCALSTVPRAQMRWIMNTESSKSQSPDPGVLMKALSNQQFGSFQGKRGGTWYCDCNFYISFYPMEIKKIVTIKLQECCYPGKISILTKVPRSKTRSQSWECDCIRSYEFTYIRRKCIHQIPCT